MAGISHFSVASRLGIVAQDERFHASAVEDVS